MDTLYDNDNGGWITAAEQVSCATTSSSSSCFNRTTSAPQSAATLSNLAWTYMGPIVFIIGIIGNTLVLFVMTRPRMRGTSTSTYLILMSLIDTVVLCSGMIPPFLAAINVAYLATEPPAICKISKFCEYSSGDAAIWIRVQFTLDRFVAICFPMRKTKWCLQWRAKFYALAALLVAMVKNSHVFWTRGARYQSKVVYTNPTVEFTTGYYTNNIPYSNETSDRYRTTLNVSNVSSNPLSTTVVNQTILVWVSNCDYPTPAYAQFETYVRPYILVTLLGIIPFIAIALSNIFIVRSIIELRRVRRSMSTSKAGSQNLFQTTAMCLTASVSFFLFVTPTITLIIGRPYWNVPPNATYLLVGTVCNLTYFLNFGINCYLYCLTGSRFRDSLLVMLRCRGTGKMGSSTFGNASVQRQQVSNPITSRNGSQSVDPPSGQLRNGIHLEQSTPEVFTIGIRIDNLFASANTPEQDTNANSNNIDRNRVTGISLSRKNRNNLESESVSLTSTVDRHVDINSIPILNRTIAMGIVCSLDIYTTLQRSSVQIKRHFTMPLSKMADRMTRVTLRRRSYSNRYSYEGCTVDRILPPGTTETEQSNGDQRWRYPYGDSWI